MWFLIACCCEKENREAENAKHKQQTVLQKFLKLKKTTHISFVDSNDLYYFYKKH